MQPDKLKSCTEPSRTERQAPDRDSWSWHASAFRLSREVGYDALVVEGTGGACPNKCGGDDMGVSNPLETMIGILTLLDEVHAKMDGTRLATFPWRPASPEAADELASLAHEALRRCNDITEAVIVVTVAAMVIAQKKAA